MSHMTTMLCVVSLYVLITLFSISTTVIMIYIAEGRINKCLHTI